MKTKYPNIFEPLTVKRTTIRNRIAMTPMGTNYGEANGEMSNRHMNYYSLRAKGGVGLIILENANVEYPVGSNGTDGSMIFGMIIMFFLSFSSTSFSSADNSSILAALF